MALTSPAGWLTGYASRLKFPKLLAITATLFIIDLWVPDFIPFADEILLGLLTVVLATVRERRQARTNEEQETASES